MLDPWKLEELYVAIGSAVWHLQFLEDVLVTYVTMRTNLKPPLSSEAALEMLSKERRKTLGVVMNEAKSGGLLGSGVSEAFAVLEERNWLIHRSMHEASDSVYNDANRADLIARIRSLTERSIELKKRLYGEVVSWCKSQGVDVDAVEAVTLGRFDEVREA